MRLNLDTQEEECIPDEYLYGKRSPYVSPISKQAGAGL
jgi:hypothetical protein